MAELPQTIGRFNIVGFLAAGGMAEVFLAKLNGPGGFERALVIKRALPHLSRQTEFREMFLDEARIMARIQHPNVVHVQELGEDSGDLFLVMEYLEGESLSSVMKLVRARRSPLPWSITGHIASELLNGLHAAHELADDSGKTLNLVHRDVSPQNIFLTYQGGVKLLDFGIAKFTDRTVKTSTGQLKGKFAYMSPEQCRCEPLDRRSDLFSVGIVLWELLAGRRLYRRGNELLTCQAIVEEAVPKLNITDPVGRELESIARRALAKDRNKRFASAQEMRAAVLDALRLLPRGTDLQTELSTLIVDVFADRVAEKRELLRRVRAGDEVLSIPSPEVEVNTATSGPDSLIPPPRRANSNVPKFAWFALAGLIGVGAVAVLWFGSAPSAGEPVVVAAAPGPSQGAALPTPMTTTINEPPVAPNDLVSVAIETTPTGAYVFLEDVDHVRTPHGQSPVTVQVPRSELALKLILSAEGYEDHFEELVPDVNQRSSITLRRRVRRVQRNNHPNNTTARPPNMDGFVAF